MNSIFSKLLAMKTTAPRWFADEVIAPLRQARGTLRPATGKNCQAKFYQRIKS
jgi:hypothetical protein